MESTCQLTDGKLRPHSPTEAALCAEEPRCDVRVLHNKIEVY